MIAKEDACDLNRVSHRRRPIVRLSSSDSALIIAIRNFVSWIRRLLIARRRIVAACDQLVDIVSGIFDRGNARLAFHPRMLVDNFPLTAWIFDLGRIMLTRVKCINELATANRTKKKARYEPISSRRYNAVRACYGGACRSSCSPNWIQGFASAGLQGQAEELAGFREQKRCSVSAIFRLA